MNDMVPYFAKVLETIERARGTWSEVRVGVFRRQSGADVQIGEFRRNYPSLFHTFAPFRAGGRDLALYSPDYTCTRLLELPSCQDIGGEDPDSEGFCPVDFFVPYYVDVESREGDKPVRRRRKQMPVPEDLVARTTPVTWPRTKRQPERIEYLHEAPIGPLTYHPFGFVAGCIWGDDSSWKLQYLDLSQAATGILRREERFGHVALPDGLRIQQAVDLRDYQSDVGEDYGHRISVTMVNRFDLRDGRPVDPYG